MFILSSGVSEETNKNIFPSLFRCSFACLINLREISSPFSPPVVINFDSSSSSLFSGRYGALNVIKSNLFFLEIFANKLDLIALKHFDFASLTASGFMSTHKMLFLGKKF